MITLVIGVLLAVLKYAEVGPFATLSWWWVALPFAITIVWWEIVVPLFKLDKEKEHEEFEKDRKKRMEKNRSGRANM
jgi:small Trp-rich protein